MSSKVKKIALRTLAAIFFFWIIGCAAIYTAMRKPPETFGRVMMKIPAPVAFLVFPFETMWLHARAGELQIGRPAPDFTLNKLDHSAQVQLSSFTKRGRPVVLVFGSYT